MDLDADETGSFRWLGHSTVLVSGADCDSIAVDPWRWRLEKAKVPLVLVTHGHADHCSEDDIAAAAREDATILCPSALVSRLRRTFGDRVRGMREIEALRIAGADVLALPAEGPARAGGFHPRGHGLSWRVDLGGTRHLFLGDSAALAEHEGHAPDVAYFAISGLSVMDPEEAAEAAARVRPRLAVPVHWGDLGGRYDLVRRFAARCEAFGVRAASRPARH